jgi:uncharacterized protein (DUF2235 family)
VALYAFDGTWNAAQPEAERNTNVAWFCNAYDEDTHYEKGVGTRAGKLGRVLGGITGAGGRTRCRNAMTALMANLKAGDRTIDIVGFSRGAALALHFANQIFSKPLPGFPAGSPPPIRFLGLWDCVPSFGVPTNKLNVGWDLRLPDNVGKCYHALALDERRQTFALHRPDARVASADQEGRLFEVWFRGVHSDVGGGNRNDGLAALALHWMFAAAAAHGVPLDDAVVQKSRARANPDAVISERQRYDLIPNRFRVVRWNDTVHASVSHRGDGNGREHNNPPVGLAVVDDDGAFVGQFNVPSP